MKKEMSVEKMSVEKMSVETMLILSCICTLIDTAAAELEVDPVEIADFIKDIVAKVNREIGPMYAN